MRLICTPSTRFPRTRLQLTLEWPIGATSRKKSINMEERIEKLNRYLVGWLGYYQLADTPIKVDLQLVLLPWVSRTFCSNPLDRKDDFS